jgi:polyisoprenoid-binding protein YceI
VARFEIDEVLRGAPKHVVGTTDQVAGQIVVDPADPAGAQIGEILINVRTLTTDSEFRDRSIKNRILLTDEHEFVRFRPTALAGLPSSLVVGEPTPFQLSGDLEIIGNAQPVTFEGSVMLLASGGFEGSASATIRYADFGITIPASRSVDAVEDTLILALDFVAEAQP